MKWKRRCYLRASYTVEASFMVPLVLLVMGFAMQMGLNMYEEICKEEECDMVCSLWEVSDFYKNELVGGIVDELSAGDL